MDFLKNLIKDKAADLVKDKAEDILKEINSNPQLIEEFKKDPIKTIEKLIGIDLPDDTIKQIIASVKENITAEDAGELLAAINKIK